MRIYGISSCNTVKKALTWLDEHDQRYEFYDFKKHGVDADLLAVWAQQCGWEKLLNRQGMTWRQLPDALKSDITSQQAAFAVMLEKPSIIKRPVLEYAQQIVIGFNPVVYAAITGT